MNLLKYLTSIILLTGLFACSSNPSLSEEKTEAATPNAIVLIFDHSPVNRYYIWPDGVKSLVAPPHELRYIDDHGIIRYFVPDSSRFDTLTIRTNRKQIEVQHAYLGIDHLSYLFQQGDSVVFTYSGKKPTARVLNRDASPLEVNYAMQKREKINKNNFRGILRTQKSFAFRDSAFFHIQDLYERVRIAQAVGVEATLAEHEEEIIWLDSLREAELLTPAAYRFYAEKLSFELAGLQMKGFNLPSLPKIAEEVPAQTMLMQDSVGGSYQQAFHLQDFMRSFRYQRYLANTPMIQSSNARYADYRQGYDSIRMDESLPAAAKKQLLFHTMEDILSNFSLNDRLAYWEKFKQDVPDSALIQHLTQEFGLNKAISNELELEGLADQSLSFSDLLAQNRNKLVYVDFWASWCAPCIRSLPASHALKEKYKGQDVAFLYLSIDEDAEKWKVATEKYGLADNLHSFVVVNQNTSRMLDELALTSIPRYLVYDREGKLVHENAPGPESEEIEKIFEAYLNKQHITMSSRSGLSK